MKRRTKSSVKTYPSLTDLMRKKLGEVCPYDPLERTWAELIVEATLKMAVGGDTAALHQVCAQLGAAEMKRIEKILLTRSEDMANEPRNAGALIN